MENNDGQRGPYERDPASHDMNDMDADQEEKAPDIEDYITSPNLLAKDGSCNACDKVVDIDCESIQCFKCKNRFHAINCSNEKLCVSATTSFKNHLLPAVNKVNAFAGRFGRFLFQCDFCITAQEKAVTLKTNDHISSLNKKFEDMKSSFSRELSEVKQLLTTSIQQTAPMNPVRNPWDDSQRCAKLRSMVVIKNDEHGSPINKAILETKCVQNKISIVNTMQLKKSKDTAVILNSKKDADALMKQLAQTSPQHSTSSVATKLPRITVVGLERNYSKSELKDMVSSQNSGIYTLVNSASDDEDKKIDVLAVVPLKNNPNLYKAIIRVSNLIRSIIAKQNDRLFIGSQRVCKVYDNFFVLRCFNCQKFGHHSRDCESTSAICGHCSGSHETQKCNKIDDKCCANCKSNGVSGEALHHAAYDPGNCPLFKDLQDKVKKTTPFHQQHYMAVNRQTV